MRTGLIYRLVTVAMLVLSVSALQAQESSDHKSLPHFHQVNDKLYRGAQPTTGGLQELAKLGIKTIVNLSGKGEGVAEEETQTRNQGLRYFNVPLKRSGRPHDADIERILSIINTPEYQPVFVHCKEGVDRTGAIIAVYRIAHDGWTSQQARAEAERYGMHEWAAAMKNYIHDFHLRHTKPKASHHSINSRRGDHSAVRSADLICRWYRWPNLHRHLDTRYPRQVTNIRFV